MLFFVDRETGRSKHEFSNEGHVHVTTFTIVPICANYRHGDPAGTLRGPTARWELNPLQGAAAQVFPKASQKNDETREKEGRGMLTCCRCSPSYTIATRGKTDQVYVCTGMYDAACFPTPKPRKRQAPTAAAAVRLKTVRRGAAIAKSAVARSRRR